MAYLFLILAIGLFVVSIKLSGVVSKVRTVIVATREAVSLMKSTKLSEEQKEAAVQEAAIRMLGAFFSILGRVAFVLAGWQGLLTYMFPTCHCHAVAPMSSTYRVPGASGKILFVNWEW